MAAGNNSAWQPHIWSDQRRWHALSQSRVGALIQVPARNGVNPYSMRSGVLNFCTAPARTTRAPRGIRHFGIAPQTESAAPHQPRTATPDSLKWIPFGSLQHAVRNPGSGELTPAPVSACHHRRTRFSPLAPPVRLSSPVLVKMNWRWIAKLPGKSNPSTSNFAATTGTCA